MVIRRVTQGPDLSVVLSNTGFEPYENKRRRIRYLIDHPRDNRKPDPEESQ